MHPGYSSGIVALQVYFKDMDLVVRAHRLLAIRSLIVGQVVDGGHGVPLGKGGGCFEERS